MVLSARSAGVFVCLARSGDVSPFLTLEASEGFFFVLVGTEILSVDG